MEYVKMRISELIEVLEEAKEKYGDNIPIYFDSEARTFDYHMCKIGNAYINEEPMKHVCLYEAK